MKVCSVCNEIVSANQRCVLSNCPNKGSARPAPKSGKVTPGPTGRSDRAVQAGLDRAGDVARDATRRAAFAIAVIFAVVAAIAAIGFNLGGDNRNKNADESAAVDASPQALSPEFVAVVEAAADQALSPESAAVVEAAADRMSASADAAPQLAIAAPVAPVKTDVAPANVVMVQLGAFGDSAKAESAWAALNKRFIFLSLFNRKIAEARVEGGRTVFRLQAITSNSSEAQQLCAKLRLAGENCLIVR